MSTTTTSTDSINAKKSLLEKFLTPNSKPTMETFPELPDCIIWMRFIMALCYATWLVISPSRLLGGANILMGINFVTFIPVLYCQTYLGADQTSFGTSLVFGGVLQSAAVIILIWIYFYSESHFEDVAIFASAMSKVMSKHIPDEYDPSGGGDTMDTTSAAPPSGSVHDSPIQEESEF
jgi:uncharacterized protein YybS (DUF2232 family)